MGLMSEWAGLGVAVVGSLLLLMTSGHVVNGVLRGIAKEDVEGKLDKRVRDTGVVVGKCENILITVVAAERAVLAELFGATWCSYCPNARAALSQLQADYGTDNLVCI